MKKSKNMPKRLTPKELERFHELEFKSLNMMAEEYGWSCTDWLEGEELEEYEKLHERYYFTET